MHDNTDSNEPGLAALRWFEQLRTMDVDKATLEAHHRWLKTPANAEAYTKVERVFALLHTLADSPEIALLSEETNKRIEGGTPAYTRNPTNPHKNVTTPSENSK